MYQQVPAEFARADAMAKYNEALIAPLMAELVESRRRIEDLARENGTLTEWLAGLERVRDAAMAHAAELETRLSVPPAVPDPRPDPFSVPNPPSPNAVPRRWRRWWLALAGAGLMLAVGASCQQASSVKHAGLCSAARTSMDFWSTAVASQRMLSDEFATVIRASVDIAEKVC